jgi:hypothetical protein
MKNPAVVSGGVPAGERPPHVHCGLCVPYRVSSWLLRSRQSQGLVSKRIGSPYISGRSRTWLKLKNPMAPAVKREAEEDWGKERWR